MGRVKTGNKEARKEIDFTNGTSFHSDPDLGL